MDGNRQSTPVAFGDTPASGGYVVALLRLLSPSGGGVVPKGPGEDSPAGDMLLRFCDYFPPLEGAVPKGPGEDPPAAKNRLTFNFQLFS